MFFSWNCDPTDDRDDNRFFIVLIYTYNMETAQVVWLLTSLTCHTSANNAQLCTPQPLICRILILFRSNLVIFNMIPASHKKMNFKNHIKFQITTNLWYSVLKLTMSCLDFQLICDLFDATLSVFFFHLTLH